VSSLPKAVTWKRTDRDSTALPLCHTDHRSKFSKRRFVQRLIIIYLQTAHVWHVLTRDHAHTHTHTHFYLSPRRSLSTTRMSHRCLYSPPALHHRHSRHGEDERLSWPNINTSPHSNVGLSDCSKRQVRNMCNYYKNKY